MNKQIQDLEKSFHLKEDELLQALQKIKALKEQIDTKDTVIESLLTKQKSLDLIEAKIKEDNALKLSSLEIYYLNQFQSIEKSAFLIRHYQQNC